MSINYYLVCHDCRKRIHIAQDGLAGWSFYRNSTDCMSKLGAWLDEHAVNSWDHAFHLLNENDQSLQDYDYADIRWENNDYTATDIERWEGRD